MSRRIGDFKMKLYKKSSVSIFIVTMIGFMILSIVAIAFAMQDRKKGFILGIVLLLYGLGVIGFLYWKRTTILEAYVDFAVGYSQVQKGLMNQLDIPFAVLDNSLRILWANKLFKSVVTVRTGKSVSIRGCFPALNNIILGESDISDYPIAHGDKYYRVRIQRVHIKELNRENIEENLIEQSQYLYAMYLFDETQLHMLMQENIDQRPVVGLVYIDNYEETLDSVDEVRRSLLTAVIQRKLTKYFHDFDGLIKKIERDKYLLFVNQKQLDCLIQDRFSILNKIKTVDTGSHIPVTLSIGIGMTAKTLQENYDFARNAIDLALGRGGDQCVVKEEINITYFGGNREQQEKSTRVKARVKAFALRELIENKDKVIIMGHKIPDFDCFGAAVGIYRAAKSLNKPTYIVMSEVSSSVEMLYSRFATEMEDDKHIFIKSKEAEGLLDDNTLLIVVDTNNAQYVDCPSLLSKASSIVVFDHHRKGPNNIQNATLSYIEPYASSTCEMVTEILQYIVDKVRLRPLEADCLYSGIILDTGNFMNKTGVRTFEAAAFLRRAGADIIKVRKLFRDDLNSYKAKAATVSEAEIYREVYAIGVCHTDGIKSPTIVGSQAANELLNIKDTKASFVLTPYHGEIFFSARSIDEANVQLIMERMGGGGHLNMAGTQLENVSIEEGVQMLKETIDQMLEEGVLQ